MTKAREKNIERKIHPLWEKKGLYITSLESEVKKLEEEIQEEKDKLKEKLAQLGIDVYEGKAIKLTRRISPKQYGVSLETALKYASLQELANAKVLDAKLKPFEKLMKKKNITLTPKEYMELRGAVEYLTIRKKK